MKSTSKSSLLANIFGTLGYLACLTAWSWIGIIFMPSILGNEHVEKLLIPMSAEDNLQPLTYSPPSIVSIVIAMIVTILVLGLTIYVLLRAPVSVAGTGKKATTKVAEATVPLITQRKNLPKDQKEVLTAQLIKVIKLIIILLPVAVSFVGHAVQLPLPVDIVVLFSGILAMIGTFWFSAQYILARILKVPLENLV